MKRVNRLTFDYGNGGKKYGECDFHYYQKDLKAGETEIVNGETYYILVDQAFEFTVRSRNSMCL